MPDGAGRRRPGTGSRLLRHSAPGGGSGRAEATAVLARAVLARAVLARAVLARAVKARAVKARAPVCRAA
jgi:hypothetical protein